MLKVMNQNNKNIDFSKGFESTNLSTNSPVQNFSLKKEEFKRKYQDKNRLLRQTHIDIYFRKIKLGSNF